MSLDFILYCPEANIVFCVPMFDQYLVIVSVKFDRKVVVLCGKTAKLKVQVIATSRNNENS